MDKCVVRNEACQKGQFNIRERHNERKNQNYHNGDVVQERTSLNMHFKECDGTYEQAFNRMLEDGTISIRGQRKDAKVFDELVFDVNTSYFERNGGYEYARQFFEEAYKLAIKEVGGEQYILSAVMHADERNKAVSEQLGHDVFHYHLHVVYVPVVDKVIKWTERCKDKSLVGTVKEVIKQVSHSKKWAWLVPKVGKDGEPILTKNGKQAFVNSYSLLQDRFFEHMKTAGFTDIERGERGSTAEHLEVLDYKIQQDKKAIATLENDMQGKAEQAATLDKQLSSKQKQLSGIESKITVGRQATVTFNEIEQMAKKTLFGKMELTAEDWGKVAGLAKKGVVSEAKIADLKKRLANKTMPTTPLPHLTKVIGNTTYEVNIHFSKTSSENVHDKLKRIILNDFASMKNLQK